MAEEEQKQLGLPSLNVGRQIATPHPQKKRRDGRAQDRTGGALFRSHSQEGIIRQPQSSKQPTTTNKHQASTQRELSEDDSSARLLKGDKRPPGVFSDALLQGVNWSGGVAWGELQQQKQHTIPHLTRIEGMKIPSGRFTAPASLPEPMGNNSSQQRTKKPLAKPPDSFLALPNLSPKVFAPAGKGATAPWSVLVERKKREYSEKDIGKILETLGISSNVINNETIGSIGIVPLEVFDNSEWEEWNLELISKVISNSTGGLKAKALSGLEWIDCTVIEVLPKTNSFKVNLNGDTVILPRLNVLLWCEDPERFAKRIFVAWKTRRFVLDSLRSKAVLLSMPLGYNPENQKTSERIKLLALSGSKKKKGGNVNEGLVQRFISEATKSRDAAFNRLVFEYTLNQPSFAPILNDNLITQKPEEEIPQPPFSGFHSTYQPEHFKQFAERKATLLSKTFLSSPQVIRAWVRLKTECEAIQTRQLFVTKTITKTLKLSEFDELQTRQCHIIRESLAESWLSALKNHVKMHIGGLGKGWFCLDEKVREFYEASKMRIFLVVSQRMMEDSLWYFIERNLQDFVSFIEFACPLVSIDAQTGIVENKKTDFIQYQDCFRFPLFQITMQISKEGKFRVTPQPQEFIDHLTNLLLTPLSLLQGITALEPLVLTNWSLMYWGIRPTLSIPDSSDESIVLLKTRLQKAIEQQVRYLEEFTEKTIKKFEWLGKLDPQTYANDFISQKPKLKALEEEAKKFSCLREEILRTFPNDIAIGMFSLTTFAPREQLATVCRNVSQLILANVALKARKIGFEITGQCGEIYNKLQRRCATLEEAIVQRNFSQTVPSILKQHENGTIKFKKYIEILDSNMFDLTPSDYELWVSILTWPQRINGAIETCNNMVARDNKKFSEELIVDQNQLQATITEISSKIKVLSSQAVSMSLRDSSQLVQAIEVELERLSEKCTMLNIHERLLGQEVKDYSIVSSLKREVEPHMQLWIALSEWTFASSAWDSTPFKQIDSSSIENVTEKAFKSLTQAIKIFSSSMQQQICNIANNALQDVQKFKPLLPLVVALRSSAMRPRHWKALEQKGFLVDVNADSFRVLMVQHIPQDQREFLFSVRDIASKEEVLENSLRKLDEEWKTVKLDTTAYRDGAHYILKPSEEVFQKIDDDSLSLQSMSASAQREPFAEAIELWTKRLSNLSELIEQWLLCQKRWLYLEPVFRAGDISKQLPEEGKLYQRLERQWDMLLSDVKSNDCQLLRLGTVEQLAKVSECTKLVDRIEKGLADYLDAKRALFPRFYFLSNDDLLSILSHSDDPSAVQKHLRKQFESIDKLELVTVTATNEGDKERKPQHQQATAIISLDGERVQLYSPVHTISGKVEMWLSELEGEMRRTIRWLVSKSLSEYDDKQRTEWIMKWPGQISLVSSQIMWTRFITEALSPQQPQATSNSNAKTQSPIDRVKIVHSKWLEHIESLTKVVRSGNVKGSNLLALGSQIVIDVHARDVLSQMIKSGVSGVNDFLWTSQLRYYLEKEPQANPPIATASDRKEEQLGNVVVRMVTVSLEYGNEYLGNPGRLVITPLTDRCYQTLALALGMQLGGAPQGPAGTGKTETTKDLAKAVGRFCVCFNCSDSLDYLAVAKFFRGIVASGSYACFDEFNRIELEVLSVIAQQIMSIQHALQAKLAKFIFEGAESPLNPSCGIFITMNPGYSGRVELPDNLKTLFRPVAMVVPDYAMIAEIMLISFGFGNAASLARKIAATFRLASEQLSLQCHYDFGMRAIKTVISAAGGLKSESSSAPTKTVSGDPSEEEEEEEIIILKALEQSNVAKFIPSDVPLFRSILSDLFPNNANKSNNSNEKLRNALISSTKSLGLEPFAEFIDKCEQLYELIRVRHGVMLIGQSSSGKSSCIKVLAHALTTHLNKPVAINTINPKSISSAQLYGDFNGVTREWNDGILPSIVRSGPANGEKFHWVVFDGPVDAMWIENMNTVLDDNKKLCLSSGEVVPLMPGQTMLFEVEDLRVASLATVSRCGMVYMEQSNSLLHSIIKSWFEQQIPQSLQEQINKSYASSTATTYLEQIDKVSISMIEHIHKSNTILPFPISDAHLLGNVLRILESFLNREFGFASSSQSKDSASTTQVVKSNNTYCTPIDEAILNGIIIYSVIWGIGATLPSNDRQLFDIKIKEVIASNCEMKINLPIGSSLFDYCFDVKTRKFISWIDYSNSSSTFQIETGVPFDEIIVPTVDTIRHSYLLDLLISNGKNVLISGETGTSKTVVVKEHLLKGLKHPLRPLFMGFSATTNSNQVQDFIDSKLEKRRKGLFMPMSGNKLVISIDDLNMPNKEDSGAQPPLELLRQLLDTGGWYDRKTLTTKKIVGIQIVGTMSLPGGGRNEITSRLSRHFNLIVFNNLEDSSLFRIFNTIILGFFKTYSNSITELLESIVNATIQLYKRLLTELLPTPSKPHYVFNLRDLSKVFQGIVYARKSVSEPRQLVRLWIHECTRVFRDRLVDKEDCKWFDSVLRKFCALHPKLSNESFYTSGDTTTPIESVVFSEMFNTTTNTMTYLEITDKVAFNKFVSESLDSYNQQQQVQPMDLVLFWTAIEHVSRIARILKQPSGNVLLLGMGGTGRQSLARLATNMCKQRLVELDFSNKSYGLNEFHEDMKKIMFSAGLEGKETVCLLSDQRGLNNVFLEDLNNLLNTGEIPNIMAKEDEEHIIQESQSKALSVGSSSNGQQIITREIIYSSFIKRVKQNLHIVLCMSAVPENLRQRLRMFPSLVSCCSIDFFSGWPTEALTEVADRELLSIIGGGERSEQEEKEKTRKMFSTNIVRIHESAMKAVAMENLNRGKHLYVTPATYLSLLSLFKLLKGRLTDQLKKSIERNQKGLEKLCATEEEVRVLQKDAEVLKPELEKASANVDETVCKIKTEEAAAAEERKRVMIEEADVNKKAEEIKELIAEAQRQLDEALPALRVAERALSALNPRDINEVHSMLRPPSGVKLVMEAVCIIKGIKPKEIRESGKKTGEDYWDPARIMMGETGFLRSLIEFDKDHISEETIEKLQPYIRNAEFSPSSVSKVSKACTSLCMWVRALESYHQVLKIVVPKKKRLAEVEQSMKETMNMLAQTKARLKSVEENLKGLQEKQQAAIAMKADLESKIVVVQKKLERAERMLLCLGDEKQRWGDDAAAQAKTLVVVPQAALLCAAAVTYFGALDSSSRTQLICEWKQHLDYCTIDSINNHLKTTLTNSFEIQGWILEGLPSDGVSIDNAIILTNSIHWPLIIDPQGQATKWLSKREPKLEIISLSSSSGSGDNSNTFVRKLQNSVRYGIPTLLEDATDDLDPVLEPLLKKEILKQQGSEKVVRIGDVFVSFHPDFKLYITTRNPNPHFKPHIAIHVTLVDFSLTLTGLQDQILSLVVSKERPDLEKEKAELVLSQVKAKQQVAQTEDHMLDLLSSCQGKPLDDDVLIDALTQSKDIAVKMKAKSKELETTEKLIDKTRVLYKPVAKRAGVLFFAVNSLSALSHMYQFSLGWFIDLFDYSIASSAKSPELDVRLKNLDDFFCTTLFVQVCQSIFEEHKLLFSFIMAVRLMEFENKMSRPEWDLFLSGSTTTTTGPIAAAAATTSLINPNPAIIPNEIWNELLKMQQSSPNLYKLIEKISSNSSSSSSSSQQRLLEIFKQFQESDDPMTVQWENEEPITIFQRLLLVRLYSNRQDKVVLSIQRTVEEYLGKAFIEVPSVTLANVFQTSNCKTPIVVMLSSGADPMDAIRKFACDMHFQSKLDCISLGKGQGKLASEAISIAKERGRWVLLMNAHLAGSWMKELEIIVRGLNTAQQPPHRDFRLWLTSMPYDKFPVYVLQNSVKMTNEPPSGIKNSMKRCYGLLSEYFVDPKAPQQLKKLLYALSFVHAQLLERKRFGSIGWNVPYEFTTSDLLVSAKQLKEFINERSVNNDIADSSDNSNLTKIIPFEMLKSISCEINYGGRITDDWDRKTLQSLLGRIYSPEVVSDSSPTPSPYNLCPNEEFQTQSHLYDIPSNITPISVQESISKIPLNDEPFVFGLHSSARTAKLCSEALKFIDSAIQVDSSRRSSSLTSNSSTAITSSPEGNNSSNDVMIRSKGILERLSKHYKAIESLLLSHSHSAVTNGGDRNLQCVESSMETVLRHEIGRYAALVDTVMKSLNGLLKALRGLEAMSTTYEAMQASISANVVPQLWLSRAYPCTRKLSVWISDLVTRLEFIESWAAQSHSCPQQQQNVVFSLSGFFFPQAFLTGVLQTYARKHKVPIDTVSFSYHVLKPTSNTVSSPPEDGCYISGLRFQGASWNNEKGILSEPSSAPSLSSSSPDQTQDRYPPLPILWLKPITNAQNQPQTQSKYQYVCPVYKTASPNVGGLTSTGVSANYLLSVELPTDIEPSHWTRRGTALFCSVDS